MLSIDPAIPGVPVVVANPGTSPSRWLLGDTFAILSRFERSHRRKSEISPKLEYQPQKCLLSAAADRGQHRAASALTSQNSPIPSFGALPTCGLPSAASSQLHLPVLQAKSWPAEMRTYWDRGEWPRTLQNEDFERIWQSRKKYMGANSRSTSLFPQNWAYYEIECNFFRNCAETELI